LRFATPRGAFLVGYGLLRYMIEFTRQPDPQLGFVIGPFSKGQILSSLMIVIGVVVIIVVYNRPSSTVSRKPDRLHYRACKAPHTATMS
jgi:phosphatidylglycerol:prolipoprotein diacylglycerol transferase